MGDIDRYVRAHDVKTGEILVGNAARDVGSGIPGELRHRRPAIYRRHVGLGGGSPRNVPAAIVPDIKIPQSGQALYVFALPGR